MNTVSRPRASELPGPSEALWYKDAVIYQLHVKSFFDANNDGVGDFKGLLAKLDYIANLGVDTIWLLPFYPSPGRDDGYDIADYRNVASAYGSLPELKRFIKEAHRRGLRVITELVVNHTSDQHPWFQRARQAKKGSVARDFYVWSDNDQKYAGTRIIFCDTEKSNWTWDPVAQAYYWHRFYAHQPDLNYDNPKVLDAMISVMRYWLDMGVDGLRLDAVPYLVEREGTNNENLPETHAILRRIRAALDEAYSDRLLLAEANQWPEDTQEYFGQGDECHMAFHFPLMPRMYMAIARADRFPITDILRQTPDIPDNCQWAIFLRNHDELTLEMVTSAERDYLWDVYAADPRARLNLGIRRRLAPLLEGDRRRIELMTSLLLSMPGTPVLYYGDEIGMGDNVHLGDRDGVRTPMQWNSDRNGGFSRADPEALSLPAIMGPVYGYEAVNVESQQRNPHSLLNWTRRLLAKRQQTRVFGRGSLRFLFPGNRHILAYLREYEGTSVLCVANLSDASQPVELELSDKQGLVPVEVLGTTAFPTIGDRPYQLTLPPYGFYWFELSTSAQAPQWQATQSAHFTDHTTLVLRRRADQGYRMLESSARLFEREVLPRYLLHQRWFRQNGQKPTVRLAYSWAFPGQSDVYLAEVELERGNEKEHYFLPFVLWWQDPADQTPPVDVMALIRRGAETGFVSDACFSADFVYQILELFGEARQLPLATVHGNGMLRFVPEPHFQRLEALPEASIRPVVGEQSNTSLLLGDQAILKLVRSVLPGQHPEAEMLRHLANCEYGNVPRLLGEMQRIDVHGQAFTLAMLVEQLENQGNAWDWSVEYLHQTLDAAVISGATLDEYRNSLSGYAAMATVMGERLAQLHVALSQPCGDQSFHPDVADDSFIKDWFARLRLVVNEALEGATDLRATLTEAAQHDLDILSRNKEAVLRNIDEAMSALKGQALIRLHGDLHLGQMLVVQNDVYFIDFEGEPLRSVEQRRSKDSPWRDVAGVVRSFDYAAAVAGTPMPGAPLASAKPTQDSGVPSGEQANGHGEILASLLAEFRTLASNTFLDAYRNACKEQGLALQTSANVDESKDALAFAAALVEKAAYEVVYERKHRPQWLPIPLAGLLQASHRFLPANASGGH